jgi:2-pyrone-4,6-dicarboxylate lactonase
MTSAAQGTGYTAPAGSCDCHMHVFGDPVQYPYAADRRNLPPADTLPKFLDAYRRLAQRHGIERMVLVQPSTYGRDNACMLDAMRILGDRARGIVDVDEQVPETELARLHRAGVRGVRINAGPPNRPPDASLAASLLPRLRRMDAVCAEIGWQLDLLGPWWLYDELLPSLKQLRCKFTVAHFGMFRGAAGAASPAFRRFVDFLRSGDKRCWVKLTAPYRIAEPPLYQDAVPIARALLAAVPDRVIWGSDYPFLSHAERVDPDALFGIIGDWISDERLRRQVLVDNPKELFGFSP